MRRELAYLRAGGSGLRAWLRLRPPLMPLVMFLYCLFVKGLILNGRTGIFYALQRLIAEASLALMVIEERLRAKEGLNAGTRPLSHSIGDESGST